MDEDTIETNFDSVITTDPEFEYEDQIEFELSSFTSLIYSVTNNKWIAWYIDNDDGNEYESYYTMEEYKELKFLVIGKVTITEEELINYLGIVLLKE
jgi:hypothetical protein